METSQRSENHNEYPQCALHILTRLNVDLYIIQILFKYLFNLFAYNVNLILFRVCFIHAIFQIWTQKITFFHSSYFYWIHLDDGPTSFSNKWIEKHFKFCSFSRLRQTKIFFTRAAFLSRYVFRRFEHEMSSPVTGSSQNSPNIDKACVNYGTYNRRSHARAAVACMDDDDDDRSSELSDSGHFLAKGAFLITPSNELNLEKATAICEKMNYRGPYSVTRTATGILFKFADQEDYHVTYRKGFHKVTNSRFYKKVSFTHSYVYCCTSHDTVHFIPKYECTCLRHFKETQIAIHLV